MCTCGVLHVCESGHKEERGVRRTMEGRERIPVFRHVSSGEPTMGHCEKEWWAGIIKRRDGAGEGNSALWKLYNILRITLN